jgi:hypothetical protein
MARHVWICSAALATASLSPAQPPDAIARQQQMRDLADQKADAHVRESIREAEKLAKTSVVAATERLKQVRVGLDTMLVSNAKKEELFKALDLASVSLKNPNEPTTDPVVATVKADRTATAVAMKTEVDDVTAGVNEVARLIDAGRTKEAEAKALDLARRYPNNPAAFSLIEKGTIADRLAASRALAKMQNERVLYTFNDVARSAMPAMGDVEFPKNWREMSARRLKDEQLSPELQSILKALDTPISTQLQSMPFEEAVQQLSTTIDQPIYLDKKSLEDLPGFDLKKSVTPLAVPNGTKLTARTVLRALLQSQGLTFIVRDNIIQVMTVEKAQTMLVKKAYYIGDVVQAIGPFGGATRWGTYLDYQQTEANVKMVIEALRGYDPMAWREKTGGPGAVTFHYPSMSLVVTAPAEVHATLGTKLGPGR